jgi:transketolase
MSTETMREAFIRSASTILDEYPEVCVILADIGAAQFRESGAAAEYPDRVINVGIREQLMIGVAAGMSIEGFRPIVHGYAPFLVERPYEQIKLDFAHQDVNAVLVSVGASYDASAAGRTHQAPEDVALMRTIPGCTVCVPGHPGEVDPLLRRAVSGEGVFYLRLSEETNQEPHSIDGITVVRRGGAATVLAIGPALQPVLDGTPDLDLTVLYTAVPKPLDSDALARAVGDTDLILVEPYLEGTSMGEIAGALGGAPRRYFSAGVPALEHRRYGSPYEHRKAHRLDAEGIRSMILARQGSHMIGNGEA